MNTQSLLKKFRADLFANTGIKLDFRTHQFINNQYGASPVFDYDDAKTIVEFLYEWANEFIRDNEVNYPHFGGWEYNLQMSIEELRTTRLKTIIEDKCHDLYVHFVAEFRKEGSKVFKYSREDRAYIYDHSEY